MNIVKRELKANFKSMIIWSLAIGFLVFLWMVEYESFANNPAIDDFMAALPEGMMSLLGMQDMSLSNLEGFIASISLYLYLLLGVQAVLLGTSIISKEERDKTAEYLFTRPISRRRVLVSKIGAAFINIAILNIVTLNSMIISTRDYDKGEEFYNFIYLMFIAVFIIQMIYLSLGMLVASISEEDKKSGNISVAILMITFIISSLINIVDSLDFLKYISPFQYFNSTYILEQMSLETSFLLASIIIILVAIAGTLILYPRRDLNI